MSVTERVGPKLRSHQQLSLNEWRAHVDQTVSSKSQIENVLSNTQGDLKALNRDVSEEMNKMATREKYINNQFVSIGQDFKEVKQSLEELETKSGAANEVTSKLQNELAEINERADEMKDTLESKDSGIHDSSPLVRMKAALQHIKNEVYSFDLRVGVISNTLLASRIHNLARRKHGPKKHKKHWKNHHHHEDKHDDDSYGEQDE
jgi:intraflagellar transport protein 57